MGFDIDKLETDEQPVKMKIGGNELNLSFKPKLLTPALLQRINDATETNEEGNVRVKDALAISDALALLLSSWDLEQDGIVLPISVETISNLPYELIDVLLEALNSMRAEGNEEGENSDSG